MLIDGAGAAATRSPTTSTLFDKLSSVFASGNATRDDAPNHIRVQQPRAAGGRPDVGLDVPGAGLRDPRGAARRNGAAAVDLNITPSNCVQCGAITAKGGRLTPPEGGDGPLYQET